MRSRLLQEVGLIIHGYYQARGNGLEKACNKVIDCVEAELSFENILHSSNVFKLSSNNLDTTSLIRTDMLLSGEGGRLYTYEPENAYPYSTPTLRQCKWKKTPNAFGLLPVTIDELLSKGCILYLLRNT